MVRTLGLLLGSTAFASTVSGPDWFDVDAPKPNVVSADLLQEYNTHLPVAERVEHSSKQHPLPKTNAKGDEWPSQDGLDAVMWKYNMELGGQEPHYTVHVGKGKPTPAPVIHHHGQPAAYKFVSAIGERAFTFMEATMACRKELDPSANLCSLKEMRSIAKQHSALPSVKLATKGAEAVVTDWGWTGAPYFEQGSSGAFPSFYHIARFAENGLEDGGPRWSSSASVSYEHGAHSADPSGHRAEGGLPSPGWTKNHPVTFSNAHCCSHFKRFTTVGHMGDFTLHEARLKCGSLFSGHVCSVKELQSVFATGVRVDKDRWGWTNTPSTYGDKKLNYHTANLWGGSVAAPGSAASTHDLAKAYGGAKHDPDADVNAPAHREWQLGSRRSLLGKHDVVFKAGKKVHDTNFVEHHTLGRVLSGSQNSASWKGAAFCCKGTTFLNHGVPDIKKWLLGQQVEDGKFRSGLFKSLDVKQDHGHSLPWPEAAHRSRVYDNAMADIALLIDLEQSEDAQQSFQLKAVLRNLYALQALLEDWSEPLGSKTIAFAFNLDGAAQPHWKSPVYTVDTVAVVGQAFAHFALQTGSTAFNRDIQALAKWVVARQRKDGLLSRGFNGEHPLDNVLTEDNLEAWFFLRMCSSVLTDTLYNYTETADVLEKAIIKELWNPKLGSFDMWLGSTSMGKEKLKVLKMLSRGAIFLLETQHYSFARVLLDHPFWIQHEQDKHSTNLKAGQGWGAVIWAEGAAAVVTAYRRLGDPSAPYMLQDIQDRMILPNHGVQTVAQNEHQFFPYASVSSTAWYLIAQSPSASNVWKHSYEFSN